MENLWKTCGLEAAIQPIGGELYRLVESQEQVATMELVDNLEDQGLLEEMLDAAKPPPPAGSEHLHYLLYTPFRYPPLKYGSRYGARHEPSLFYGGLMPATVMAEAAYYRFVFWQGMHTSPISPIRSQHTLFSAEYATKCGIKLQEGACTSHRETLTDPSDYRVTQELGSAMREAEIGAFEFPSARCPDMGTNVALFTPSVFVADKPKEMQSWLCETDSETVIFSQAHSRTLYRFSIETFLVEGKLPWPAG
ncbi:MAG: RES family NAD+ phosphorylase [Pseudomonadota bacterium]